MAINPGAARAKVGNRQRGSNLERARRIAAKNPDGRVAQRLNSLGGGGALGASMAPTNYLTPTGRIATPTVSAQAAADARPNRNVSHQWATRRMPGSPF